MEPPSILNSIGCDVQCCLDLDDLFTCQSIAARLVKICPGNKRAQVLLNLLMSNSLGKENDGIHGRKRYVKVKKHISAYFIMDATDGLDS